MDNETGIRVDDIYPGVLEFDQDASLYADDAGFIFGSKEYLVSATNTKYKLLERMGLMMHVGKGDKASKTEALYVPGYGHRYIDGNTTRFTFHTSDGDGFIDFCTVFPYIGSKISSAECSDASSGRSFSARICVISQDHFDHLDATSLSTLSREELLRPSGHQAGGDELRRHGSERDGDEPH